MLLIKEVSQSIGLNSSAIRYYEKQGLISTISRSTNNYRVFDKQTIERLIFIKKAKSLGFSLEEIRKILTLKSEGNYPCNYVNKKIQDKIAFMEDETIKLQKERDRLKKLLSEFKDLDNCSGNICSYIENNGMIERR